MSFSRNILFIWIFCTPLSCLRRKVKYIISQSVFIQTLPEYKCMFFVLRDIIVFIWFVRIHSILLWFVTWQGGKKKSQPYQPFNRKTKVAENTYQMSRWTPYVKDIMEVSDNYHHGNHSVASPQQSDQNPGCLYISWIVKVEFIENVNYFIQVVKCIFKLFSSMQHFWGGTNIYVIGRFRFDVTSKRVLFILYTLIILYW